MALGFFAVYEASGRTICEEDLDEMLDILMVRRFRKASRWIDMNRLDKPWFRKLAYRLAHFVAPYLASGKRVTPEIAQELMPLFCELDNVMITLQHGVLHRQQTIAFGGDCCDYWITGDRENQ